MLFSRFSLSCCYFRCFFYFVPRLMQYHFSYLRWNLSNGNIHNKTAAMLLLLPFFLLLKFIKQWIWKTWSYCSIWVSYRELRSDSDWFFFILLFIIFIRFHQSKNSVSLFLITFLFNRFLCFRFFFYFGGNTCSFYLYIVFLSRIWSQLVSVVFPWRGTDRQIRKFHTQHHSVFGTFHILVCL